MTPASQPPFQFTGRQRTVYQSIALKNPMMAELYECALRVLQDNGNSGRIFLAAHSIREMTNGLPKVLDLPIVAEQGRLGDQMNGLEPVWNGALASGCHSNGQWSGAIDAPLERLLRALHGFFLWWRESRPKRKEVAIQLFRSMDLVGIPLPEPLEKQRAKRWLELHDYFVGVAHRSSTTDVDFQSNLQDLEQILMDSLYRQPSEDLAAIDQILLEGDANA